MQRTVYIRVYSRAQKAKQISARVPKRKGSVRRLVMNQNDARHFADDVRTLDGTYLVYPILCARIYEIAATQAEDIRARFVVV